jgi:hypothetical protein
MIQHGAKHFRHSVIHSYPVRYISTYVRRNFYASDCRFLAAGERSASKKGISVFASLALCGMWLDVICDEMKGVEKKYILGIVTDEDAMFDLLWKFLCKEGYEVKRVLHEVGDEDFALLVHAPARSSDLPKSVPKSVKTKRIFIGQPADDDFVNTDEDTVVLSERPLNLRKLSDMIEKMLAATNCVGTIQ